MFNRYWRTYPWALQVALFLLTVITLTSFATYLVLALVPRLSGLPIADITQLTPTSTPRAIRAALLAQVLYHSGLFTVPALIFAGFTHPKLSQYLGFRVPGRSRHWLYVTGIMLGLIPVFLWGEGWMIKHLHFGSAADQLHKANETATRAFLNLRTIPDLLLLLGVMALLPALGEELFFRGVLLRLLHRRVAKTQLANMQEGGQQPDGQRLMVLPVMFTSLLFGAVHASPYGFIFIFTAGCVLALIYYLTGSLFCSIWAHFIYNGTQVLAEFWSHNNKAVAELVAGDNLPVVYPIVGLMLFVVCFYMLVKSQTPMPNDWSDDFKGELAPPTNSIF
jgi:uncharacterized protein